MDFHVLVVACASHIEIGTFVAAVVGREGEKFARNDRENAAMVRDAIATFVAFNIAPALTFDGSEGSGSRSSRSSESRIVISHFSSLLNNIGAGGTTKISSPSSPDIIK